MMKRKFIGILFAFTISLFACSDNDEGDNIILSGKTDEVRIPNVEDIDGTAVLTWVDPYVTDAISIQIKDLQTGKELSVPIGVQTASFVIEDKSLLSYKYEFKVIREGNKISNGLTIRLMKNWANQIHPRIDYNSNIPPQTGMFFTTKPVDKVQVYDIRQDQDEFKVAASTIQGIVNREYAQTYLIYLDATRQQLDEFNVNYEIRPDANTSKNKGFSAIYNDHKDKIKSLILFDENQSWSWSMAVMIAAQEDGIPVSVDVKTFIESELGLGSIAVKDIRNMWANKEEAYQWAIDNLADNCHEKICFSGGYWKNNAWRIYDYAIATKGFVFWLDELNDVDRRIMTNIFDKMNYPLGSSVFGYGMNANGDDLNKITNIRNLGFVVSDYYANATFWSSYPGKSFQQRRGIAQDVEPGKVYVSLTLSDGDNLQFDQNSLYDIFKYAKRRGEVPVGVTLAAGLQEINAPLLEFFYKNATPNEEFAAGPSGVQFIYADQYSMSGKYHEWLDMNNKWLNTAGFHTAYLWHATTQLYFQEYMEKSGLDLVMDGSDRTHTTGAQYKYVDGVVRVDQGTHCWEDGDVYRDLMTVAPSPRRPLFRNIYLLTNHYGLDENQQPVIFERLIKELERVEKDSPNTFVYMLPMDLGATIKKYIDEGGIY